MPKSLSPKKLKALHLIISGASHGEVAKQVGVSRQTISHWRNHDTDFISELDALLVNAKHELERTAPIRQSYMYEQLMDLAANGPPDIRLKAVIAYLERCSIEKDESRVAKDLSEEDVLILKAIEERSISSTPPTRLERNRH